MQSMQLPLELSSVSRARRFFSAIAEAAGLPSSLIETGTLALSELVTNAVVHGEVPIEVRTFVGDASVRVEVSDSGDRVPQIVAMQSSSRESGRGLAIVDAITEAWGFEPARDGPGKSVWFRLARSPSARRWPPRSGRSSRSAETKSPAASGTESRINRPMPT